MSLSQLVELINQFEASIKFVREALDMGEWEDLDETRQSLVKLSKTNCTLSEYQSSHASLENLHVRTVFLLFSYQFDEFKI